MKLRFRAFKATENRELCEKYLDGHVQVLVNYGITNITTNNRDWMKWDTVYCVIAEKEDGTVVGGVRTQVADGINPLPVEKAIGKLDPNIHEIVKNYLHEGVGELCALWNAKEVAGMGLSIMLVRAGISTLNQINCRTLMGICADYTLKMFRKVGFVVDTSLGEGGEFIYPNENYVARVLGILNAKDLSTAEEFDREKMLDLRTNPVQTCIETGPNNVTIEIEYQLLLHQNQSA
jgi:hypothetical protein